MPTREGASAVRVATFVASLMAAAVSSACGSSPPPLAQRTGGAFHALSAEILEDHYRRNPSQATDLGIHTHDDELEDLSQAAIRARSEALKSFRVRLADIDPRALSLDDALDREQLLHAMDERVLALDTIRKWAKDPDAYSSGITNAAYVIMKRDYAPPADRLRALIARERKMPGLLQEARKNLDTPPSIYVQIAIEQIDGNIRFFTNDVPAAFHDVSDQALLAEFRKVNDEVIAALGDYKRFLQLDLAIRATGQFAYGAETYSKALAAAEAVDLPLDQLLQIAESDRQKNDLAFQATARKIDPTRPTVEVLASVQRDHPPADRLLKVTQDTLDSLRQFTVDHHIVTIPPSDPARVQETPPFMRATTSASMDIPGPFEKARLLAFYNMTLPDPRWPRAEQADYMRQWYYAAISNTSVHEVYPGHYIQFLYAKNFPSDVRKVFSANTNVEGWAHYCEQLVLDEGLHGDDPKYRLAQIQDALLRDVRFVVGIKMHTQGMTVDQATKLFEAGVRAASRRRLGSEARRRRRALWVLHDGQDHDLEAARGLQGADRSWLFAAAVPRCLHQAGTAAAAARSKGDVGRDGRPLLTAILQESCRAVSRLRRRVSR